LPWVAVDGLQVAQGINLRLILLPFLSFKIEPFHRSNPANF